MILDAGALITANGLSSSDYNLNLFAHGFTSPLISPNSRLLTRADGGSAWNADGDHVPAASGVVYRNNLTTLSAEYTVGDPTDNEDPTVTAPDDYTLEGL